MAARDRVGWVEDERKKLTVAPVSSQSRRDGRRRAVDLRIARRPSNLKRMPAPIRVLGARQHNLKGFDLEIPRGRLIALTGVSGSGKSSLALDTLHAEGQRRYVESLSTYAKQFLERLDRPDVDGVENIPPTVAIESRNTTVSSRSTVGTATEAADYLRLLFARVGTTLCPDCGVDVRPDTVEDAAGRLAGLPIETRLHVTFPLPRSARVTAQVVRENLLALGFVRVLARGREVALEDPAAPLEEADLLVVADRLVTGQEGLGSRLTEALAAAFREGEGEAVVVVGGAGGERIPFTRQFRCARCGKGFPRPSPGFFSFNNAYGACGRCRGFGNLLEFHPDMIVPHPGRTLREGAIHCWTAPRYDGRRRKLAAFCRRRGIAMDVPFARLPKPAREALLRGDEDFEGAIPFLESLVAKKYKAYVRFFLRRYQKIGDCPECRGARLRPEALHVRLGGASIADLCALPVRDLRKFLAGVELPPQTREVARLLLQELDARLEIVEAVGLGYLTLERATKTLSGGEAQRIGLANALGARLVDALYVLDEPSVGLHASDTARLVAILRRLRDRGNTVLVVEHDLDVIAAADWTVELGPGAGARGGELTFAGSREALLASDSLTAGYLTGRRTLPGRRARVGRVDGRAAPRPRLAARARPAALVLEGASERNLREIDVRFPLEAITAVTGVSGSGKSTLVRDTLHRAVAERLVAKSGKPYPGEAVGRHRALSGWETLSGAVLVDQSPIGKSPRSNPVTYVGAFDAVRARFAATPLARARGLSAGYFSFNLPGGRCESCKGDGHERVEMQFMPDVFVTCPDCAGSRYARDALDVAYRGRTIADVLRLTVDEAMTFFADEPEIGRRLWVLQSVGLGYLPLGQPAPTLSGGEAQRLKIARELRPGSRTTRDMLYLLDEPSVGLHAEDLSRLLRILQDLVERGNTVVMVEHHLDLVARADHVIDLGPGGGEEGGRLVVQGTPAEVAATAASVTGRFLRERLGRVPSVPSRPTGGSLADGARAALPRLRGRRPAPRGRRGPGVAA
jgi:excinuclease ABC subunit A